MDNNRRTYFESNTFELTKAILAKEKSYTEHGLLSQEEEEALWDAKPTAHVPTLVDLHPILTVIVKKEGYCKNLIEYRQRHCPAIRTAMKGCVIDTGGLIENNLDTSAQMIILPRLLHRLAIDKPNLPLVIFSQSPFVLSSVDREHIRILSFETNGEDEEGKEEAQWVVRKPPFQTKGADFEDILLSVLGVYHAFAHNTGCAERDLLEQTLSGYLRLSEQINDNKTPEEIDTTLARLKEQEEQCAQFFGETSPTINRFRAKKSLALWHIKKWKERYGYTR